MCIRDRVLVMLGRRIFRYDISEHRNITATIITFLVLCIVANSSFINQVYVKNRFTVLTTLTGIFFIGLLILKSFTTVSYTHLA